MNGSVSDPNSMGVPNTIFNRLVHKVEVLATRTPAQNEPKRDPRPRLGSVLGFDTRSMAIVVVDLQKGIVNMPGAPIPRSIVVDNCVRLLAAAREAGVQPVLVHVGGSPDGADRLRLTVDAPMRATGPLPPDWSDLIAELNLQPTDVVILKRQWGAFYGTDLDLQLRRRGLESIVLCGIATEFGVESTARDAYERGYELIFAEDAMTGSTAESHINSVERIFPRMGQVRLTEELIEAFNASGSSE